MANIENEDRVAVVTSSIHVDDNTPVCRLPGTHWYCCRSTDDDDDDNDDNERMELRQHHPDPSSTAPITEANSHRTLRVPGCRLRPHAEWMAEHFTTNHTHSSSTATDDGTAASSSLYCQSAWWLHLEATLEGVAVPPGRWEVSVLFQYHSPKARPRKNIAWSVYIDPITQGGEPTNHSDDEDDTTNVKSPAVLPALLIRTGRNGGSSWGTANRWTRYTMGTITTSCISGSTIRWVIRGMDGTTPLTDVSFGGFQLRSCSVEWRKEALLLRMLRHPTADDAPRDGSTFSDECASTIESVTMPESSAPSADLRMVSGDAETATYTADITVAGHATGCRMPSNFANNTSPPTPGRCTGYRHEGSCYRQLPPEIVVRIAQFLITPLPDEALLLHNY